MSSISHIGLTAFEFPLHNTDGIDLLMVLDEIDTRHLEVASMIVATRDEVLHASPANPDRIAAMLHATLALMMQIAAPFDAVHDELRKRQNAAATATRPAGKCVPAQG